MVCQTTPIAPDWSYRSNFPPAPRCAPLKGSPPRLSGNHLTVHSSSPNGSAIKTQRSLSCNSLRAFHQLKSELHRAQQIGERFVALAELSGDPVALARSSMSIGQTFLLQGRFGEARQRFELAVDSAVFDRIEGSQAAWWKDRLRWWGLPSRCGRFISTGSRAQVGGDIRRGAAQPARAGICLAICGLASPPFWSGKGGSRAGAVRDRDKHGIRVCFRLVMLADCIRERTYPRRRPRERLISRAPGDFGPRENRRVCQQLKLVFIGRWSLDSRRNQTRTRRSSTAPWRNPKSANPHVSPRPSCFALRVSSACTWAVERWSGGAGVPGCYRSSTESGCQVMGTSRCYKPGRAAG